MKPQKKELQPPIRNKRETKQAEKHGSTDQPVAQDSNCDSILKSIIVQIKRLY